ncbi:hypothetical protein DPMN_028094 [Dreissena polymorpha]|uniref:Uncharacterized protein n=1 Tax=Dreissena polymorpha TaxID=45954 RepID=A0A9D4LW11_DREPO|nr:hypothetical protein DPMN_028094 [Dreissena polymorpha]
MERIAKTDNWGQNLTEKASEYNALVICRDVLLDYLDYLEEVDPLERKFGDRVLPETAIVTLAGKGRGRQGEEEFLDYWAEVFALVGEAFNNLSEEYLFHEPILRFCLGTKDIKA